MKDYKRFLIVGAKWWDKVNGNTYNSAIIKDLKTNKYYYIDFNYGYGECWKYEAIKYIENNLTNYKLEYNNYESVCVGYTTKKIVKQHLYF